MRDEIRNTVLYLDGIRYSVSMAEVAVGRLRTTLDEVAVRHAARQHAEEQIVSAFLDAWALIDMCHRARELSQKLSKKLPGVQLFLRSTSHVERLRHYVQHFHTGIPTIPSCWTPLWGALSWVPTHETSTCYTIFTGNLPDGLQAPSIAYDTHDLRFASQIVLYVGADQADLPSIATQMCKLRDCLLGWIEKHPKFTRADANTRVWTVSFLPQFKDLPFGNRRS